ncbi:MAG: DNA polymerase III subunit chi [Pseudomonadota bacterium]
MQRKPSSMRVDFYVMSGRFTDPLTVAAILCGKAWPACGRLAVVGSAAQLDELDERLWHEPDGRFLPHTRLQPDQQDTPTDHAFIALCEQAPENTDVMINLQPDGPMPEGRYQRILEIVPQHESLKQALRQRWRNWQGRGVELHHHELK